ncbi:hypothetical protein [Blastococcus sp. TF02A-26]|uniref:hypothetical protein n=1 Tax=Blastococcus sp. TF02A-26 TaxID=2250577 RepID=UPI000DE8FD9E|nr:hypothetical protein [Blastococcus sp. TF02A-26]RBY85955.1 hypothetical protein DQ240_11305 [Blastococcus sp. TF02A-26]
MTQQGPNFHGDAGRQFGAMAALEESIAQVRRDYAGQPETEVLAELRRVHDDMGLQLDPDGGRALARDIAAG